MLSNIPNFTCTVTTSWPCNCKTAFIAFFKVSDAFLASKDSAKYCLTMSAWGFICLGRAIMQECLPEFEMIKQYVQKSHGWGVRNISGHVSSALLKNEASTQEGGNETFWTPWLINQTFILRETTQPLPLYGVHLSKEWELTNVTHWAAYVSKLSKHAYCKQVKGELTSCM